MSYSSSAHLFWGFDVTFPRDNRSEVDADDRGGVSLVRYGDDSNGTSAVCISSSVVEVDVDQWAVRVSAMPAAPVWHDTLLAFCEKHGLPWHDLGPAWHLAASRF